MTLPENEQELKELQKKNQEKIAEAKAKIQQHKADVRRWISRGKMIDSFFKNSSEIPDELIEKRIKELIRHGLEHEKRCLKGSRDSDRP